MYGRFHFSLRIVFPTTRDSLSNPPDLVHFSVHPVSLDSEFRPQWVQLILLSVSIISLEEREVTPFL